MATEHPCTKPCPRLTASFWDTALVYQIYPRSFADHNGDGIGDFAGVLEHIDYLADLGVNAIWFSPFYPSPLADGGYDVADYRNVDPRIGTMDDFDSVVDAAHERGMRIIVDIVPNHTSDEHPWFREALAAQPGSPERERYVFRQGKGSHHEFPPTNWVSNFGGSAWEPCGDGWYYLHLFDKKQPDLNWDNPEVHEDFLTTLRFWSDHGVDGFRVDVSHSLAKDLREPLRDRKHPELLAPEASDGSDPLWDRNEVHDIYRGWRKVLDEYDPPRYAVGETWSPFSERVFHYARPDELGAVFDFSLLKAGWSCEQYRQIIQRTYEGFTGVGVSPTWVLSNHDVPRHATRLGLPASRDVDEWINTAGTDPVVDPAVGAERARSATLMMMGLPGTAYVYQGEELGLPEDWDISEEDLQDPLWFRSGHTMRGRDGCRVPLPWRADAPAFGFNETGKTWLPQPQWFARYAADIEEGRPDSFLALYRTVIALRKQWCQDDLEMSWLDDMGEGILHYSRPSGLHVAVNLSDERIVPLPSGARVLVGSHIDLEDALGPDRAAWFVMQ